MTRVVSDQRESSVRCEDVSGTVTLIRLLGF